MSEWKKVKLGEITQIIDGDRGKNYPKNNEFSNVGYCLFLNTGNVTKEGFTFENNQFISKEKDNLLRKGKIQRGDLILTTRGTVGNIGFYDNHIKYDNIRINSGMVILRVIKDIVDAQFLYQLIRGNECRTYIKSFCTGSAQPQLPIKNLSQIDIKIPHLLTQHRIATILSRYDSLIENYQKQIKLLEEAAQRLYKEWFVDLHFPGHENTKIVDGVPEGWEKKKLIEFGCTLESGSRPKGGVDSNLKDGIPSVGAENVIGLGKYNYSSEKLITNQFYSQMRKGKIKNRDILIYKDGAYIGRTSLFQDGFPHKEMAVNEHVFLLHTLNENYQYYVFFTLYQKQYFEKMQKLNKNAAQPGLNQKALLDLGMLCPSEEFVMTFRKAIEPLMKALFNKSNQIRLLTEARDRLLPKLMSGGIDV